MIKESLKDEIKGLVPITKILELEGIHYKQKGNGKVICNCPFHDDSRPSLNVTNDSLYKCFSGGNEGCKGGDVFDFYMNLKGVSFPEAIRALSKVAGINVTDDMNYDSRAELTKIMFDVMSQALALPSSSPFIQLDVNTKPTIESALRSLPTKTLKSLIDIGYINSNYKLTFQDNAKLEIRNTSYDDIKIVDCNSNHAMTALSEYKVLKEPYENKKRNNISISFEDNKFYENSKLAVEIKTAGNFTRLASHIKKFSNDDTTVEVYSESQNQSIKNLVRELVKKGVSSEKVLINNRSVVEFLEQRSDRSLTQPNHDHTYRYMSQVMFNGQSNISRSDALKNASPENLRRIAFIETNNKQHNNQELPTNLFSPKLIKLLKKLNQFDLDSNFNQSLSTRNNV